MITFKFSLGIVRPLSAVPGLPHFLESLGHVLNSLVAFNEMIDDLILANLAFVDLLGCHVERRCLVDLVFYFNKFFHKRRPFRHFVLEVFELFFDFTVHLFDALFLFFDFSFL